MQTVTATLVSLSKDGKRAMVIVRGKTDSGFYSSTRHVERERRNGPFIGANPNPDTLMVRETAARRVLFANRHLAYTKAALANLQNPDDFDNKHVTPKQIKHAELNVGRAEAMLKVAQDNQTEVEANFPLQVQFDC